MPTLEWFLVADSVSTDRTRNTVSLFHVLEEWSAPLPLVIPRLVAVSSWRIDPEERGRDFQVMLKIVLPDGQELAEDYAINFTPDNPRHRTYHFIQDLQVEKAGDLAFEVLVNGQRSARHLAWIRGSESDE